MVSVAFFAGIRATAPDMRNTADQYYDEYGMMDIRVLSTLGLTEADIEAIAGVKGVLKVQPGYFADVVSTIKSSETVFRVHSLPETVDNSTINRIRLTEGRYPEKPGECLIEATDYMELGLKVGDTLRVSSEGRRRLRYTLARIRLRSSESNYALLPDIRQRHY
jgi:putative ABC transport system permease protein